MATFHLKGNEKGFSAGEARRGFPEDSAGKSRGVFFSMKEMMNPPVLE